MSGDDLDGIVCRQNYAVAYSFKHNDAGLEAGAVVGIVVGVVVFLLIVGAVVFWLVRKNRGGAKYSKVVKDEAKALDIKNPEW